ncbi:MAG: acyltransferase [Planctomycetia bacterium]|nr:acyltransferase [Planctomycetia bacterium]
MSSPTHSYRPEIDGLRALSVIVVLLFHANIGCPGGFAGVDVFFTISGYLITGLIMKDLDAGQFSFLRFWERRTRRIFPALAVMVAVSLAVGFYLLIPTKLVRLGKSSVAQGLLAANFYFWQGESYFADSTSQKPLLHTWSLAVEEQFYLLFPLVLWVLMRWGRAWVLPLTAVAAGASLVGSILLTPGHPNAAFYSLPTRTWELLIGSYLALLPRPNRLPPVVGEIVAWSGILAIVAAVCLYDKTTLMPGSAATLPVFGAAAFIYFSLPRSTSVGRILSLAPLVFIGRISYSLYLWHWPVMAYTVCLLGEVKGWRVQALTLLISFVLGVLSWRFVEERFRYPTLASSSRRFFGGVLLVQCVLIGVSIFFWISGGYPERIPANLRPLVSDLETTNFRYDLTLDELRTQGLPLLGRPDNASAKLDFILFGDSHAVALSELFHQVAERRNLRGTIIARNSIRLWYVNQEAKKRIALLLDLVQRERVKNVCLVCRWDHYKRPDRIDESAAQLSSTLSALEAAGVERLFLFRQVPRQPSGEGINQQIYSVARFPAIAEVSGVSLEQYEFQAKTESGLFARLPTYDKLRVELIDTSRHMFDDAGRSRVVETGRSLYCDDDHLSNYGAERLLKEVVESVLGRIANKDLNATQKPLGRDPARSFATTDLSKSDAPKRSEPTRQTNPRP